jgi:hypothetical protein
MMTASAAHRPGRSRLLASLWRTRPAVRWGALAVGLSVYAIASLEPFDWEIPTRVPNRAERAPDGWRFAAPGIVIAEPPHDWFEAASAAETLGLSLIIRPLSAAQSGPARILTISRDAHMRNLTLAQEDDDLVLRLRTEDTDLNGLRAGEPFARLEDVFRSGRWLSIDLQIGPGELTIALDRNWLVPADGADAFCRACRLNRTIPDLGRRSTCCAGSVWRQPSTNWSTACCGSACRW